LKAGSDNNLYLLDNNRLRIGYSGNVGTVDDHIFINALPGGRYVVRVQWIAGAGTYSLRVIYR